MKIPVGFQIGMPPDFELTLSLTGSSSPPKQGNFAHINPDFAYGPPNSAQNQPNFAQSLPIFLLLTANQTIPLAIALSAFSSVATQTFELAAISTLIQLSRFAPPNQP